LALYEFMRVSCARSGDDSLMIRLRITVRDVCGQRIIEEHDILAHKRNLGAQVSQTVVPYVVTIQQNAAADDVIEAR
jgi:hypothetical protein